MYLCFVGGILHSSSLSEPYWTTLSQIETDGRCELIGRYFMLIAFVEISHMLHSHFVQLSYKVVVEHATGFAANSKTQTETRVTWCGKYCNPTRNLNEVRILRRFWASGCDQMNNWWSLERLLNLLRTFPPLSGLMCSKEIAMASNKDICKGRLCHSPGSSKNMMSIGIWVRSYCAKLAFVRRPTKGTLSWQIYGGGVEQSIIGDVTVLTRDHLGSWWFQHFQRILSITGIYGKDQQECVRDASYASYIFPTVLMVVPWLSSL